MLFLSFVTPFFDVLYDSSTYSSATLQHLKQTQRQQKLERNKIARVQ